MKFQKVIYPQKGAEISRTTYADLFNVIGTKFGEGDGSTTFNLPNLVGRFLECDSIPGTLKELGLPNITGRIGGTTGNAGADQSSGAFYKENTSPNLWWANDDMQGWCRYQFNASRSSGIYGASSTVQPKSLTVRAIIKY